MSSNLIQDLSLITTIPESSLQKLIDKSIECVCNDVFEDVEEGNDLTKIDCGIGSLYISVGEEEIEYKFIPSIQLEESLCKTITEHKSPLVTDIEETLVSKIMNVYKDLL